MKARFAEMEAGAADPAGATATGEHAPEAAGAGAAVVAAAAVGTAAAGAAGAAASTSTPHGKGGPAGVVRPQPTELARHAATMTPRSATSYLGYLAHLRQMRAASHSQSHACVHPWDETFNGPGLHEDRGARPACKTASEQ